ncbi:4Fe-4S binding domain-containing protein [Ferrimonas sediminum]|uniref:4Fe-4S binding domain-containing protein n=1 Tax=Ferrimonas sediminum TaxID=718193 RepID=A0A1G8JKE3_9GAMM|nr:FMN-binding protein [Ferrimonas sediminum]SDI31622.1 4Fe-4S binding domain-containing protein [Ferrimonas sediminum]
MKTLRKYGQPLLRLLAWLSLIAAFVVGQMAAQTNYQSQLANYLPGAKLSLMDRGSDLSIYRIESSQPDKTGVVLLVDGNGYGGPLSVAIKARKSEDGARIDEVALLDNRETPPYVERLLKKNFFNQFANKRITDDFIVDNDIDSYSGATITARGVSSAVAKAAHFSAVEHLGLTPSWQQQPWTLGLDELLTLLLVAAALFISSKRGSRGKVARQLKVALPLASLLYVGFYVNASISVSSLYTVLLGYLPSPKQHPIWWILMLGIVAGVALMGRNIYCNKLCPFGAIQAQLTKISGLNLRVPSRFAKGARALILTLMWASLMLVLLSRHPALGSYEPFSMMFALEGMGIQWYVLPLSLIGAFFIGDFWCRFFCPVGLSINEAVRVRRKISQKLGIGR